MKSGLAFKRFLHTNSTKINDVFIVSYSRTPMGAFQGSLMEISATQLGAEAIKNTLNKVKLPPSAVEDVMMGCVLQAGLGQAPARQAALLAGLPKSTPSTTVNKVCASGMKAIMLSAANLALGLKSVTVAGGMESLSNSPFYMSRGATPYGGLKLVDACHYDGLTDAHTSWHMGKCAEKTAADLDIGRQQQDDYARESLVRLGNALENAIFKDEIHPLKPAEIPRNCASSNSTKRPKAIVIDSDDNMNPFDINQGPWAQTPWGSTVSRASSSKLADGAAACVLMNNDGLNKYDVKPMAKILGFVDSAQDTVDWPTSPALGIKTILEQLKLKVDDVASYEINEAFSVVILANAKLLGLNLDKVNINGGAIGIGHPFGMSGVRITNHLVHTLKQGEIGIASLCNGGGGASTIAIQKL